MQASLSTTVALCKFGRCRSRLASRQYFHEGQSFLVRRILTVDWLVHVDATAHSPSKLPALALVSRR
jgi:hypothetical protein